MLEKMDRLFDWAERPQEQYYAAREAGRIPSSQREKYYRQAEIKTWIRVSLVFGVCLLPVMVAVLLIGITMAYMVERPWTFLLGLFVVLYFVIKYALTPFKVDE